MPAFEDELPVDLHYSDKTVVFVDVVESVRLIEQSEQSAVRRIRFLLGDAEARVAPGHRGELVERRGDELLLEFPDPRTATAFALELHDCARDQNRGVPSQDCVSLRIGIHRAEVLSDAKSIFGRGVNLASRITTLADSGETVVSAAVAGELVNGVDGQLHDLGKCHVKHIEHPIHAYRVTRCSASKSEVRVQASTPELKPTIAVMPFVPYQGDVGGLGIGDIIADQLIGALSRSSTINIISRLSTSALRGRQLRLSQIAERLSSHFVVSGKYWRASGRVFVQVELARVASGHVIWAQTVDDYESAALHTDSTLITTLQHCIANAILVTEVREATSMPLPNLASHTLLLASISLLYRLAPDDFERAFAALQALRERAPRSPTPLAWLARWHLFRVVQGWSIDSAKDGELALSYANRALDLDPESSLALTMAGNVQTSYRKDLDAAERLYDTALAINPNESLAWLQKGNARSFRGDGPGALAHIEKAVRLSPLDPSRHFYESLLASAALSAGEYDRAISAARSSLRMNSNHVSSHRVLAIAQVMTGHLDEASRTVQHLLSLEPNLTVASFIARSPGSKSGLAEKFGQALLEAGLPAGDIRRYH